MKKLSLLPISAVYFLAAVLVISNERMSDICHLAADLVCPSGEKRTFQKRQILTCLHDVIVCNSRLRPFLRNIRQKYFSLFRVLK